MRKVMAAIGLTTALLTAACGEAENNAAVPSPYTEALARHFESMDKVDTMQKAARQVIDLSVMPPELPQAVRDQIPAILEVQIPTFPTPESGKSQTSKKPGDIVKGSGVHIGNGDILTAGHLIRDELGGLQDDVQCGDMRLYSQAALYWGESGVAKGYSTFKNGDQSIDDLAIYQAKSTQQSSIIKDLPSPHILDKSPLEIGAPVFFINYGRDAQGNLRSPRRGHPAAVFGGIALKQLEVGGNWLVVTGMADYIDGPEEEFNLSPGASGGGAMHANGSLAGISVAIVPLRPQSAQEIEDNYDVDMVNDQPGTRYSLGVVEPVDQTTLGQLNSGLQTSPEICTPTPGDTRTMAG